MAKLAELRRQAKEMGITPSKIRGASNAEALQAVINNAKENSKMVRAKAKAKNKSPKRRTATRADRPKTRGSKSSPARSRGTAKRTATAKRGTTKRTATRRVQQDTSMGRYLLNGVDFSVTDGWNAREGSPPDRIVKLLRKHRGNRDKVYDALVDHVWDFVGKTKRDGTKRSKKDALAMLVYRISRTAWDYAMRTNQHAASENREQYGTAGTGQGIWKPAKKRVAQKRSQATKRGGAKRAGAKRSTAKRGSQKRTGAPKRQTAKRQSTKRTTKRRASRR